MNNIPNFWRINISQRYVLINPKQTTLDATRFYDTFHEKAIADVLNQEYVPVFSMTSKEKQIASTKDFKSFLDYKYNERRGRSR